MKYHKTCNHCDEAYIATKRNQKYCSNSCRVTSCYERNKYKYKSGYQKAAKTNQVVQQEKSMPQLNGLNEQTEDKGMGIGGAFIGSGLAIAAENVIKSFIPEEDKPLTLKQSKALTKQLMDLVVKHDKVILSKLNALSKQLASLEKY